MDDFFRLANNLRAMRLDYDYMKTRKLLEPNWKGYAIPKGHDVIEDDVPIIESNLVTSRVRDSDLHRPVLDLDMGAAVIPRMIDGNPPPTGYTRMQIHMNHPVFWGLDDKLFESLNECGITAMEPFIKRTPDGNGQLHILTQLDYALIPSSTPGHHHLIFGVDLPWSKYERLLRMLNGQGILEEGFVMSGIKKEYTGIRPPWVKK